MDEDLRPLYNFNSHSKLIIDANQDLKAYMKIYDFLEKISKVHKSENIPFTKILEVDFRKQEDDYDEKVHCPYFKEVRATIKNQEDALYSERYFTEFFTSKNDSDLPFYRRVDVFKCEVTIKDCLLLFLKNCKTHLDTLVLHYNTLKDIIPISGKPGLDINEQENVFSKDLCTNLRRLKLCGIDLTSDQELISLLEYVKHCFTTDESGEQLESNSFNSISLACNTSVPVNKMGAWLLQTLFNIHYSWDEIEIEGDPSFALKEKAKYELKNVTLEIFDNTGSDFWSQIITVDKLMIYRIVNISQNNRADVSFVITKGFKLSGIKKVNLDDTEDFKLEESLYLDDKQKEKQKAKELSKVDISKCSFINQGDYNIKMMTSDLKRMFEDPQLYKFLVDKK